MHPVPVPVERPSGPVRLREWTLHADRNLLESADDSRRLEPKAIDLLVLLAERRGEVVSKDELIDRVWEGRIISEGTLTNTVAELRRALGDDARAPRFIETIPKRGYRLVCPVEPAGEGAAGEAPEAARRRWPVVAAVALLACTAVTVAALLLSRPAPLAPDRVLAAPFVNRTGEPELDAYVRLAQDRILSQLAGSGIAHPVAGGDEIAPGSVEEICRLARDHGAGLAVTGAFYLHEGRIEVQGRLVDVAVGELLYAVPPVIGPRSEVTASVEEAVQRVLGAVATHLSAHAHATLLARPPVFEAYREFIVGTEIYTDDLPAAIRHMERAVEIDPEFTSAILRLATAYRMTGRGAEASALIDRLDARRGELTEFERLWLDAFIADLEGRWSDALQALTAVQRMIPEDWTVHYLIGNLALQLNRPQRAADALEELHETDLPSFVTRHRAHAQSYARLSEAYRRLGEHRAALDAARAGRETFPTDADLMTAEARASAALGDVESLDRVVAAAEGSSSRTRPSALLLAAAAAAEGSGRPDLARRCAERVVELLDRRRDPDDATGLERFELARALVLLGRLERALDVLRSAEEPDGSRGVLDVAIRGWLGTVAARLGDMDAARAADSALSAIDDPYLYGVPESYRAAIAAWSGHREEALDLLGRARRAGWTGPFQVDGDRALFEPLEGLPEAEALPSLAPEG